VSDVSTCGTELRFIKTNRDLIEASDLASYTYSGLQGIGFGSEIEDAA